MDRGDASARSRWHRLCAALASRIAEPARPSAADGRSSTGCSPRAASARWASCRRRRGRGASGRRWTCGSGATCSRGCRSVSTSRPRPTRRRCRRRRRASTSSSTAAAPTRGWRRGSTRIAIFVEGGLGVGDHLVERARQGDDHEARQRRVASRCRAARAWSTSSRTVTTASAWRATRPSSRSSRASRRSIRGCTCATRTARGYRSARRPEPIRSRRDRRNGACASSRPSTAAAPRRWRHSSSTSADRLQAAGGERAPGRVGELGRVGRRPAEVAVRLRAAWRARAPSRGARRSRASRRARAGRRRARPMRNRSAAACVVVVEQARPRLAVGVAHRRRAARPRTRSRGTTRARGRRPATSTRKLPGFGSALSKPCASGEPHANRKIATAAWRRSVGVAGRRDVDDRPPARARHRQHAAARQLREHARHAQRRVARPRVGEPRLRRGLGAVVELAPHGVRERVRAPPRRACARSRRRRAGARTPSSSRSARSASATPGYCTFTTTSVPSCSRRGVHLPERRRRDRRRLPALEQPLRRLAEVRLDHPRDVRRAHRRRAVPQPAEHRARAGARRARRGTRPAARPSRAHP